MSCISENKKTYDSITFAAMSNNTKSYKEALTDALTEDLLTLLKSWR